MVVLAALLMFHMNGHFMTTDTAACASCAQLRKQLADKDALIAALIAETEALSRHDALTGAYNRASLVEMLTTELQRSYRTGHPFCFAIIDIDQCGQINEQFGTAIGDVVLKTVADASLKLLRVLDRFARMENDSFGIMMPATWPDQGGLAMVRLYKALAACDWPGLIPGRTMTVSTGLTSNAPQDTAEMLISRAETALKQAKAEGGNKVVTLEQALPEGEEHDDDDMSAFM